ncbi:MAG: hypothetical protein A2314_09030 [Elusimicrobia bacterium RIFOXYB2_FULL_50_12]|nr:MAG: hypothetical protein A2314_09030 [Elusimicrobia bacterium RIFOXYB2_FULL_50_12]
MKIAFATNYLPGCHSHSGGAEQAILQTARLARQKGHETYFITLPADLPPPAAPGESVAPVRGIESFLPFLKKFIGIAKWYLLQFDPVVYLAARKSFAENKPDLLHCGNMQFLTFALIAAARHSRIPVIVSVYDYWYFCPLTTLFDVAGGCCRKFHGVGCLRCLPAVLRPVQAVFLALRKSVFDFFIRQIDRFIVLSDSSFAILTSYGIPEEKIGLVRLPVDADTPAPAIPGERKNFLFIGWLQKRKGLHILIQAMKQLAVKRPQARLDAIVQNVLWEKDYETEIARQMTELPAGKLNLVNGRMQRADIKRMIENAAAVVVPEQWENMSPLIVIEAMRAGTPVIAGNIGGIPEFIEHGKTGYLARHDDPADFATQMAFVLDNPGAAGECSRAALKKAETMLSRELIADTLNREYCSWIQR